MDRIIISWPRVAAVAVVMAVLFGVCILSSQQELEAMQAQALQSNQALLLAQEQLNSLNLQLRQVGSSSYIENAARKYYSYQKADELRFEISNPECLKGYTEAEMKLRMAELLQ